jgi:hypothetical protein
VKAKRLVVAAVIGVVVLGGLAVAVRAAMVWNKTRDVLPTFTPIPDGPRAPPLSLVDARPGETLLPALQQRLAALGFACRDTSMRGLMREGRAEAQRKIEAAKEAGDDPATVSGASRAGYYSKKEQNPQVQWTCENIDVVALGDATLTPAPASLASTSLIFVFDSADHPLRHVTVSRHFVSQRDAHEAYLAALSRRAALGAPTFSLGEPDLTPDQKIFARRRLVTREWRFADRTTTVTVMNLGPKKGIDVREVLEVPWPVTTTTP